MIGNPHLSVLTAVQRWLSKGQRVWLCTIVETWGSSPRPAGSWLAVSESGEWSGSVSGGCLEENLLGFCANQQPAAPQMLDYGVTDKDRQTFRLPCGGRIRLYVEPLSPQNSIDHVDQLMTALISRQSIARRIDLESGTVDVFQPPGHDRAVSEVGGELIHRLTPNCRLLLVGAGEVARYVAEFAGAADFDVTLCEPREAFASGWLYDIPLVSTLPDDLVTEQFNDAWSGVLALAHDPRVDDMALLAALNSEGFYVGAMGSVKTSQARRERLLSLGLSDQALARLHAPIGVNIPSKTPAEIAIAIVADLIQARRDLLASKPAL